MNRLIFINSLGINYKGDFIYEFIFSSSDSVWGESWEAKPANGYPKPPELKYITKVGQLTTEDVSLYLIQNSLGNKAVAHRVISHGFDVLDLHHYLLPQVTMCRF